MPDNSGIFIGGNNSGDFTNVSTGVGNRISQDSRAVTLQQVDELVTRLLTSLADATAEQAAIIASQAVALKNELHETSPDRTRVGKALSALRAAATWAAPVVELVGQLAALATELLH